MKHLTKFFAFLAVASLVIFMSCGGGGDNPEPEPPGKVTAENLASTVWAPTNGGVTLDGDPRTEWSGFTLSFTANSEFTGGSYTASGLPTTEFPEANVVWPGSGTWSFTTNAEGNLNLNEVERQDGVVATINVSETSLTITFPIDDPNARVEAVGGQWSFTFAPQ
jgi:hypothetical protein